MQKIIDKTKYIVSLLNDFDNKLNDALANNNQITLQAEKFRDENILLRKQCKEAVDEINKCLDAISKLEA